ncbi:MAG TPA: hypothetical protein EYG02_06930 [Henriciella marina]|uniref:hypothetical protein n=1 Tax=Henriciella sp. TaxID=1968823 RepID=UPI0017B39259|nr:hypothetical protein [Henriciella sp.]HIG22964.1 hypothetical protein [Henriciella sp.]HIK64748.1 hypothetical protein [Henriciella marina]
MSMLRNILTAIWCAVIIGTNTFALIVTAQHFGVDVLALNSVLLPVVQLSAMIVLGILSLVSTKYLWAILAVAVLSLLLTLANDLLVVRVWRPSAMLSSLLIIVPTYLLARWNSLSRETKFNPVQEF